MDHKLLHDPIRHKVCVSVVGNRLAVRLVAQIHDELLFEVNTQLCDVYMIAGRSLIVLLLS